MTKYERELRQAIRNAGLKLVELRKSKHIRLVVRTDDGRETVFTKSLTPSDHREQKNFEADLKRFARENQEER